MKNPFTQLLEQLAPATLQVGTVQRCEDGIAWVVLPSGEKLRVRGEAQPGTQVFISGGAIEGKAPELPVVTGQV